jgi:hypothetical protein
MSERAPAKDTRPTRLTQAAAGIAGALAFLGIGWAMGARSAAQPASAQAGTDQISGVAPAYPTVPNPGEWDDDPSQGQWGTIPNPGGGSYPALPGGSGGTGGTVPPQTGTGGS